MQLVYRGVQYQYNPVAVESQPGALASQYRSAAAKFRKTVADTISPALQLIYRGDRYTRSVLAEAAQPTPLAHPVTLTYRGVSYTKGAAEVQPQTQTDLADQARLLTLQYRQKAEQRQLSVLGRFEDALDVSADWTVYDLHQGAMS